MTDPLVEVLKRHAPVGLRRCYCGWKADLPAHTGWAEAHAAYSQHLAGMIRADWADQQLEELHRESFSDGHAQGYGEGQTDAVVEHRHDYDEGWVAGYNAALSVVA